MRLVIGEQVLLENESMDIHEGAIHVIMGESGSGKTTLLYEISLLSHISQCQYVWNGKKIHECNDNERAKIRRNQIGFILQDLELISDDLNLKDNIQCMFAFSGQVYNEEKVKEYMQQLHLSCSLDQNVESMSRGERQRFALVMALVKDVDVIICDEPTSALDVENSIELMKHLRNIAKKYHKMIVIASHDQLVAEEADFLYYIQDHHLILETKKEINDHEHQSQPYRNVDKKFFKTYLRSHHSFTQVLMKIIYAVMILVVCLLPLAIDALLDKQQQLYELYKNDEIIISNTQETLPFARYLGNNQIMSEGQMDLLKEIEHVVDVDYYWELNGMIGQQAVYVIPKKGIDKVVYSSELEKKVANEKKMSLTLTMENQDYHFETSVSDHDIKDYPAIMNIQEEIVYVPHKDIKELLASQNITTSSSAIAYVDDMNQLETTSQDIQRWLKNATVSTSGKEYVKQIKMLENIQQFMTLLKGVAIVGLLFLMYVIQILENKSREKEINNLRINGMNKKLFYKLYEYEHKGLIILTIVLCLVGYGVICFLLDLSLTMTTAFMLLGQSLIYIFITKIIPLFISVQQIFKKNISEILRESV